MLWGINFIRSKTMKKIAIVASLALLCVSVTWAKGSGEMKKDEPVTIEFIQWWEPELPAGSFRAIMDEFEAQNPGIKVKLVSGPYSSTHDQLVSGAATGTLSDVVGLDGNWVWDLAQQGALLPLEDFMQQPGFDANDVAASVKVGDKTYMFAVATFTYSMFVNTELFENAGIPYPKTRSEFIEAGKKLTDPSKNIYAWDFPFSLLYSSASQDQLMTWVWASGGRMLKDGKPNLVGNQDIIDVLEFIKEGYEAGIVSPGVFSKQSQDMVEEFATGRAAFMINGLSHIAVIRGRNPDLKFDVIPMPVADGYMGISGVMYAPWGIGISANSKHPEEAWKLVSYLMSPEVNSKIAEIASSLPGNKKATAASTDPVFLNGFKIFQQGELVNEFQGMPVANELSRIFTEEVQKMLQGKQTIHVTMQRFKDKWNDALK